MPGPSTAVVLATVLALAACAQAPTDPEARAEYDRANDPAEPTNRVIFAGNQAVDRNVLKPVAIAYRDYVPAPARHGLHSFVANLGEPRVLVNDLLQGNLRRAWNTTERFAVNTTIGGAGLFDVATDWGMTHHDADFGQTFGVWGIAPGPSVQIPLLGPSNVRDAVGSVVGFVANPLNLIPGSAAATVTTASSGAGIVDGRAEILDATNSLEKTSLDYYAALRSVRAQRRAALVEQGKVGDVEGRPGDGKVELGPLSPLPGPAGE